MVVEATEEEWKELQDLEPRVVTLDIEVDDRGDEFPELGEERILSIVAHDNYTDETRAFLDLDGKAIEDVLPEGEIPEAIDALDYRTDERQMLIAFRSWFEEMDPDLITGWNADDFDIPFIIKRMENIDGLNPNVLSPEGWSGISRGGEPRIKGRTVYDLLTVYKKNSFTNLRSYRLDDVAKEELDAEKIEFDGSYFDLYENNLYKFLDYNAHDVTLTVGINEEAGVIKFRDVLRREVGVDFEDSYDNKDFVDMMCRRKLRERQLAGPTRPPYGQEPDSDLEGAYVFDAYTGVAKNVVGIDLASLYPYTMAMLNASPETKVDPDEFDGPTAEASNGQHFRLDEDGLFKELVDDAISLKSDYKEKLLNAETPEERARWEEKYSSAKTITNSIYGVTGWVRFFLYDEAVAEAVTLTGQMVIKRTAEFVESDEVGLDVIYGDTDSTYIKYPDDKDREYCLEGAQNLCDTLNETIYPDLAESIGIPPEDNLWEIEVEAYMERFFQAGRKKRYAYLATWKDGQVIDDPKISVSGFSSKRSDSAQLTVETEEQVFDAILHGREGEVDDIIFDAAQEIQDDDPQWERIGIPGGMNNKIDPEHAGEDGYYAFSSEGYPQDAHPRAVWNSNKMLDVNITVSDKPMRVYIEQRAFEEVGRSIDVIAFLDGNDLQPIEDEISIDKPRMLETVIKRPLREVADAVGVDIDAAVKGQTQTGLGAFAE
jgi:DNA polymerase I